ncbi:GPI transamidase component PIG-T [Hyaloraphidium curvatum]|nr:GPI transamidase component PIG-T [Hyaloraphidium curvatum]
MRKRRRAAPACFPCYASSASLWTLAWPALLLLLGAAASLPVAASPRPSARVTASDEVLRLRTLPSGMVLAEFNFTTRFRYPPPRKGAMENHYGAFPRTVGHVTQLLRVSEWHLTFTQGRWNHKAWGAQPQSTGPTGVHLWTWFEGDDDVDERWRSLANTLSGIFCASLNFIDSKNTAEPTLSFRPLGGRGNATRLRVAALPREATCTENLTPWIKMLPCKAKAGLSQLLNPYRIYDANYHSMSVDLYRSPATASFPYEEMIATQSMTLVMDPVRLMDSASWTVSGLFQREVTVPCAVAGESRIDLQLPAPPAVEGEDRPAPAGRTVVYHLRDPLPHMDSVGSAFDRSLPVGLDDPSPLHVHRFLGGYGLQSGRVLTRLENPTSGNLSVALFDALPWWMRMFLHTMQVWNEGEKRQGLLQRIYYLPARDRERPASLELLLLLPANTTTFVEIGFERAHLRYTEHPPDANRGFDVAGCAVTVLGPEPRRFWSENILVALPTPDFSMPYNVITMTCTLFALYFGSLFNLLTRKFKPVVVPVPKEYVKALEETGLWKTDAKPGGDEGGADQGGESPDLPPAGEPARPKAE